MAHDLHPGYLSTRSALETGGLPKIGVQHHHAHIASCMAENGLDGRGDRRGVRRHRLRHRRRRSGAANFWWRITPASSGAPICATCRWPAAMRPCASRGAPALAYLMDAFGAGYERPADCGVPRRPGARGAADDRARREYRADLVLRPAVRCRGVAHRAAARSELRRAGGDRTGNDRGDGDDGNGIRSESTARPWQIDFRARHRAHCGATLRGGVPPAAIAARFHNTLAAAIVEVCRRMRAESKDCDRVCLSGGTFQNMRLLGRTVAGSARCGFDVFLHAQVPPNDGGIALGQAVIAAEILRRG